MLCHRGLDLHRRGRGAVAARRAGARHERRRDPGHRPERGRHPWRLPRPGLCRLGRTLLGHVRAGRHPGPDAQHHARPHRAGRAGGGGLPGQGPDRGLWGATGIEFSELRVDGGACRNDFLMQFQSDILGCTIDRSHYIESTGMGRPSWPGSPPACGPRGTRSRACASPTGSFLPQSTMPHDRVFMTAGLTR